MFAELSGEKMGDTCYSVVDHTVLSIDCTFHLLSHCEGRGRDEIYSNLTHDDMIDYESASPCIMTYALAYIGSES